MLCFVSNNHNNLVDNDWTMFFSILLHSYLFVTGHFCSLYIEVCTSANPDFTTCSPTNRIGLLHLCWLVCMSYPVPLGYFIVQPILCSHHQSFCNLVGSLCWTMVMWRSMIPQTICWPTGSQHSSQWLLMLVLQTDSQFLSWTLGNSN